MSGPRQPAIAATGVRRSFGETLALDDADVAVAEGTIVARSARTAPGRRQSCGS
jgi:ABC-type sugar transport system ATPase subunit